MEINGLPSALTGQSWSAQQSSQSANQAQATGAVHNVAGQVVERADSSQKTNVNGDDASRRHPDQGQANAVVNSQDRRLEGIEATLSYDKSQDKVVVEIRDSNGDTIQSFPGENVSQWFDSTREPASGTMRPSTEVVDKGKA